MRRELLASFENRFDELEDKKLLDGDLFVRCFMLPIFKEDGISFGTSVLQLSDNWDRYIKLNPHKTTKYIENLRYRSRFYQILPFSLTKSLMTSLVAKVLGHDSLPRCY